MLSVLSAKILKGTLLLSISLVLAWCCTAFCFTFRVERAKRSFEAYVGALQDGGEQGAKRFWNRQEVERYRKYDWQWEYLAFRRLDPRRLNYKITGTDEREDHVVLEVEWFYQEDKGGRLQKDERFFVEEDGRMVGANAMFIHTRGWIRKESQHFVYHYRTEEQEPGDALLTRMDEFYEEIKGSLQVDYQGRIDYYRCSSSQEVGRLFGLEPSLARSQTVNGVVASVQRFVPHEIVHVISYRLLPQDERRIPAEYLSEGLAYHLGGASFFSPELLLSWANRGLEVDQDVFLDSLIRDPWLYGANQGAGVAASFAKFLMEKFGILKFKGLYAAGESPSRQREALEEIYGKDMSLLEAEWKEFVRGLALPEVRIPDRIRGTEVFHMLDPRGDDRGDGDYVYPNSGRAVPGVFDLIGFRINSEDDLVYFQLQFANLNPAELSSDQGFNGTFAAIVIDCDDHAGSGNTRLFFDNGNVEFSPADAYEFVIEVSNAGVLVYDQDWVWHLLFLKALSERSHIRGNEIAFAVPHSILGTPGPTWKVQVLTGGQTGGRTNTAHGVGKFSKVGAESTPEQGGGGTNTGFSPDIYDILTPRGLDQARIIGSYDLKRKRRAVVPMISLTRK